VIRNVDTSTHGFYLPALGLRVAEIKPGEVQTLSFAAPEKGEFPFYCSVWCSDYHMQMRGTLVVR
jgi:heme/copper-type cytochrome/quinol oxidase subunit 2